MKKYIVVGVIIISLASLTGCGVRIASNVISQISESTTVDLGESIVETKKVDLEGITRLNIDTSVTNVSVLESEDVDKIEIELKTYEKGPRLTVSEGKVLKIEVKSKNKNLNMGNKTSPKLIIEIPKKYSESIKINSNVGNLEVKDIDCDKINIDSKVGNLEIEDILTAELIVDASVGNIEGANIKSDVIELNNSIGNIDMKNIEGNIEAALTTGNANFELEKVSGDFDFSGSISNLDLIFSETEKLNIELYAKASIGKVTCEKNLDEITEKNKDIIKGKIDEGKYKFNIKTTTGNIEIR